MNVNIALCQKFIDKISDKEGVKSPILIKKRLEKLTGGVYFSTERLGNTSYTSITRVDGGLLTPITDDMRERGLIIVSSYAREKDLANILLHEFRHHWQALTKFDNHRRIQIKDKSKFPSRKLWWLNYVLSSYIETDAFIYSSLISASTYKNKWVKKIRYALSSNIEPDYDHRCITLWSKHIDAIEKVSHHINLHE